ncbi:MAG: hypothetical protein ACOCXA_03010, partial [Planctomycetota bacterium]
GIVTSMALSVARPTDEWSVEAAAAALESTLSKARAMARQTERIYAVTFNVENAGDGLVPRNFHEDDHKDFPGRHWYAIVGPNRKAYRSGGGSWAQMPDRPPEADRYPISVSGNADATDADVAAYEEAVRASMIGGRRHLGRGVRFLALSDHDLGLHSRAMWNDNPKLFRTLYDGSVAVEYHPRPWFGVLVPDRHLPGSLQVGTDRWRWFGWGVQDEAVDAHAEGLTGVQHLTGFATAGRMPDVLRGEWMDYALYFRPDGRVEDGTFTARCRFFPDSLGVILENTGGSRKTHIEKMSRYRHHPLKWWTGEGGRYVFPMGIAHEIGHTGGYHITLARDVDPEDRSANGEDLYPESGRYDVFANPEDALRALRPLARVFVNKTTGSTELRRMDHPLCRLQPNQRRVHASEVPWLNLPTRSGDHLPRPAYPGTVFAADIAGGGDWHPPYLP